MDSDEKELTEKDIILIFLETLERMNIPAQSTLTLSPTEDNFNEILAQINNLAPRLDYIMHRHPFLNTLVMQLATDISNKMRDIKIITNDSFIKKVFDDIKNSNLFQVLSDMVYEALKYGNAFGYLRYDKEGVLMGVEPLDRMHVQKQANGDYIYFDKVIDVNYVLHLSFLKVVPYLSVGIPLYYYGLTTAERAAMLEDLYVLLRLIRGIPIKKVILNLKKNYTDQEVQMLKTKLKEKLYYSSLIDANGQINLFNTLKVFDTIFMEMQMDGQKIVDFEILELKGYDNIQDDEILILMYNKLYSLIPVPSYYKELLFRNTRISKSYEQSGAEYTNKLAIEKQDYAYSNFVENLFSNIVKLVAKTVIVSLIQRKYYNFNFEVKSIEPAIIDIASASNTLGVVNEFISSFLNFVNSVNEINKVAKGGFLEIDWNEWFKKIKEYLENVNMRVSFVNEKLSQQEEEQPETGTENIFESVKKQLIISTTKSRKTTESTDEPDTTMTNIYSNKGNSFFTTLILSKDLRV